MPRKRVPWDGPDPRPGDYLAGRVERQFWLIIGIEPMRHPDAFGARLVLELEMVRGGLPEEPRPTVHPWQRTMRTEPEGPQRVRQLAASGSNAVMRGSWRDPDDKTPNAVGKPREIGGFRTYCPLRRILAAHGRSSQITPRHIAAADLFRVRADIVLYGYSAPMEGMPVDALIYGSRIPSDGQVARVYASADLRRLMARLAPQHRNVLSGVVLQNRSIAAWCAKLRRDGIKVSPAMEMGKLVFVLDMLVEHYDAEIAALERVGAAQE